MSQWMGIRLERLTFPADLIPDDGRHGNGQGIPHALGRLDPVCKEFGLTPLDRFIVDHDALVEDALDSAGWEDVDLHILREVIGADPTDTDQFVTRYERSGDREPKRFAVYENRAEYDRACHRHDQIVAEVERAKPWFPPDDALRTVCGLLALGKRGVALGHAILELRTFERELRFAQRNRDRFHFAVSY